MSVRYPRPEVLDRIPRAHHAVIEASAGTGKTHTIEHLVVELLLSTSAALEQVLVLTFTEKATAELKRRIRGMLARILAGGRADAGAARAWVIDDAARRKLEAALLAFDTASVHTIHGFFQRVLTAHAFPIGRPLEQEMVDGAAAFGRAFRTALRTEVAVDPLLRRHLAAWLEDQERRLEDLEKLLYLCLAYHRRGTRFVPEYRPEAIARLVRGSELPACPDGPALKAEMKELNAQTAKAIARRLDQLNRALCAFRDTGDTLALLSAVAAKDRDGARSGPLIELLRDRLAGDAHGSATARGWLALVDELAPLAASVESAVAQALLPAVVRQLDRDRAARGQFDFDDMIRLVWEALQGPGADALVANLRGRYRFALIDEFQDTDDVQWRIFQRLFFAGTGHVCYLVGDPKQAIYGFRGADVHAYLDATRAVREAHGQEPVPLDRSYRSTPDLLAALNRLFRQEDPAPFFTDPAILYRRPVECGRPELALTTTTGDRAAPIVVMQVRARHSKQRMEAVRRTLARAIAHDVAGLLAPGSLHALTMVAPGDCRPVKASDVFVLTRATSEGRLIGEALREAGVPHMFYKQEGLFQTAEAEDVRDVLMAVEDPADRSRRSKAWLSPFFDVPLDALPTLAEVPHGHPLVQRLEEWNELARRREHERLFAALADDSGLVRRLLEAGAERELTNYLHLFEILLAQAQAGARLADLVVDLSAWIAGERLPPGEDVDIQRLESDRDAVQIMTMHKSKGLEADVVYVFGGFSSVPQRGVEPVVYHEDGVRVVHVGRSGAALARRDCEREHEDQRLLYVALTRARGRVVLPLLPADELRMEGSPYALVNRRLADVIAAEDISHLVEVRDVGPARPAGQRDVEPRALPAAVEWPAEPDLAAERLEIEALAQRGRALEMTSYSRIKRAHGGYVSPIDADAFKGEAPAADPLAVPAVEPDALPGGVAMGILLHEVIEQLPLDSLAGARAGDPGSAGLAGPPAVDAWARDPRVAACLDATLARHGADARHRPAIERLVHRSLTAPVRFGGVALPGLAGVPRCAREMEFVFPLPEPAHPALGARLDGALVVERGYVQGVIDLVFELDGRWYFADWKTDILPDYAEAAVRAHVERNYRLQAELYALAMVKMLGIRDRAAFEQRFGGLLYCFLRGMRAMEGRCSPGVHFERPGWEELVAFDGRLRAGGEL